MSIRAYISGLSFPGPEKTILKRRQKHPATFQCTLCPKRFTRSFNLRSHLRTHTDERPFVCYLCGMAFARSHDRGTHEKLHTGEKKYVCGGLLNDGRSWGCGRRFARASNLARHFRSEAGKICINPVLVEKGDEGSAAMTLASISGSAHHHMNEQPAPTTSNSSAPITGTRSNLLSPYATAPEMGGTKVDWELWDDLIQQANMDLALQPISAVSTTMARPSLPLTEKVGLLESILREKGFDVDAELSAALRNTHRQPRICGEHQFLELNDGSKARICCES